MQKGAFFITLTKRLPSPVFYVHEYETYQMSWGGATVYIQQKTTSPTGTVEAISHVQVEPDNNL
jgi:hypothetical protein